MSVSRLLQIAAVLWSMHWLLVRPVMADVYYVEPISELKIIDGELPVSDGSAPVDYRFWWRRPALQPYAVLDGGGDIYVTSPPMQFRAVPLGSPANENTTDAPSVAIRVPIARGITGKIFLPKNDYSGMVALKFSIAANHGRDDLREKFLKTKLRHYQMQMSRGMPGTAWFRHQLRETRQELDLSQEAGDNRRALFRPRAESMEQTYALISGGRAVSENLQLDRMLPEAEAGLPTVDVESIQGITVQAFDWTSMIKDAQPKRDPLTPWIPDDQYVIFLPSFQAMVALADHASEQGTFVLRATETRAEDARVRQRYERQLGLGLNQVARVFGSALIRSVALTGADPYFRTGADVAVLFEATDVDVLRRVVDAQVALSAGSQSEARSIQGAIQGVPYTGFRAPDRSICSYVAALDKVVVVTNSPAQLERLIRVWKGEQPSLASLDEYTFFRDRYPLGDVNETGLLILSDNTIRKWCGPRWRIASSRRTRAAALMADMQSAHFDRLVHGKIATGPLHTACVLPGAGEFTLGPQGVESSVYGTLGFLTPILELEFTKVTKSEADFYERWRVGYERNWSNFFDPIAIQFHASSEKLAVDLTVMPLIGFSDYRQMVAISQGAVIGERSGDPHAESLVHGVLALNTDAEVVRQGATMASMAANVDPLSWIGQSIALYVDDDPIWAEFAKIDEEQAMQEFMVASAFRLPIAANIEVKNGFKLIAFLAGLRTFIEQSAPGMTVWETLDYKQQTYVRVGPSARAQSGNSWDKMAIYYVPGGDSLVVSISEDVLKRAIDRQIDRRKKNAAGEPVPRMGLPWLGENLCVTVDGKWLQLLRSGISSALHRNMQLSSWRNLGILNEWHARYPDRDSIGIHQRFWHRKLVCPGGGEYRWNDNWQTMESTVYGHPGEPRRGTALPTALASITSGNFGQTFEGNGLRARVELARESSPDVP